MVVVSGARVVLGFVRPKHGVYLIIDSLCFHSSWDYYLYNTRRRVNDGHFLKDRKYVT
jgi:hypothetical protein